MAYEGFRIPNAAAAAFTPQARIFDQDLEIVADGARGNGIIYTAGACAVLPQAAPNMTVRLTLGGTVVSQSSTATVTTGNVTIAAAHATLPRIDVVSVDNAGTKIATAGTAAAAPLPPVIPQSGAVNNIVLAFVYVPPAATAITASHITDKRIFVTAPGAGSGTVTTTPPASAGNLAQFATGTSITNANLSGDVTTSGTLATTIAANAVSYAKIQDVSAASRLVGRGSAAGAGDPQEIVLGTNLTMSGTTLNAAGGGGTTPTGTGFTHITAGAQDAAAKLVDTADVNNAQITFGKIQNVSAASRLLGRGSAGGAGSPEEVTLGTNLSMSGTTLNASGAGGSIVVRKNTGADVGTRPRLNLIEGSNVTLTVADDAGGNEVDITIASSAAAGGGDFSSNTAVSVDGEVVLFSGTLGKTGKRSTGTGVARLASGVQSAAELSGDVTTSGSNAATIAANAVSYAKIQDVTAASRLIGRGSAAGAGDPQELTLGTNLSMSGTVLNATGGGTTPTGTGFTHITAGVEDGAAKLVDTADVNNDQITFAKVQNVSAASRLLGRGSAAGAGDPEEITLGSGLTMTGTTLSAPTGGGGTVTTSGTPASPQIALFTSGTAITGDSALTYDTTNNVLGLTVGQLDVAGPVFPVVKLTETSSVTTGYRGPLELFATTSGVMADTFGVAMGFNLRDNSAVDNRVGAIGVERSGADNSASLTLWTANAGSMTPKITIAPAGAVTIPNLAGSGVRMVTASAAGLLATDTIPSGGGSSDTVAIVASDVVHTTNSVTLENITGLAFSTTGGAAELWWVEALLIMNTNALGGSNCHYKIGWSVSGAQTGIWGSNPETGTATSLHNFSATLAQSLAYGGLSNATGQTILHLRALIRANGVSGPLQLQFAQNGLTSGAVVTAKADSTLIVKKVRS